MNGAASIASHGRIAKVSGKSVGSFGRALSIDGVDLVFSRVRSLRGHVSLNIEATDNVKVSVASKSHVSVSVSATSELEE